MSERKYRRGDRVQFWYVTRTVQGTVREDRGPLGIGGRHLYLIEFVNDRVENTTAEIELPAAEFEPAPAVANPA